MHAELAMLEGLLELERNPLVSDAVSELCARTNLDEPAPRLDDHRWLCRHGHGDGLSAKCRHACGVA